MMKERIQSAIVMLGGLALMLVLRYFWSYSFDIFWAGLSIIALNELLTITARNRNQKSSVINYLYPILFVAILFAGYFLKWPLYLIVLFELLLIVLIMLGLVLIPALSKSVRSLEKSEKKSAHDKIFYNALTSSYILLYPALLMGLMYPLNHIVDFGLLNTTADNNSFGLFAILFVLVTSMLTDTMAMLGGMIFKGKKIWPRISYKKTISGFITGIVCGTIFGVGLYLLFTLVPEVNSTFALANVSWWKFAILAFVSAVATSLGDLLGSYIKRRCFVKDFGNLFPGHGGLMDRINGQIINIPVVLIGLIIIF